MRRRHQNPAMKEALLKATQKSYKEGKISTGTAFKLFRSATGSTHEASKEVEKLYTSGSTK